MQDPVSYVSFYVNKFFCLWCGEHWLNPNGRPGQMSGSIRWSHFLIIACCSGHFCFHEKFARFSIVFYDMNNFFLATQIAEIQVTCARLSPVRGTQMIRGPHIYYPLRSWAHEPHASFHRSHGELAFRTGQASKSQTQAHLVIPGLTA